MKKHFLRFALLMAGAVMFFSSCEKEEVTNIVSSNTGEVNELAAMDYVLDPENMDEGRLIAMFKPKHNLSKGYCGQIDWLETGTAVYVDDLSFSYRTMKVYRKSDPNKYFYVMLTNLNIPDSAVSWSYAKDKTNDQLYGRLYSRLGAEMYCHKVKMYTDVHRPNRPIRKGNVFGSLMTEVDLCDILEIESYNPDEVYDLVNYPSWGWDMYYDAFVFGLDDDASEEASYHTLAGWKNPTSIYDPRLNATPEMIRQMEIAYEAGYYSQKNHRGMYWMKHKDPVTDGSQVLSILRHNYWSDDDYWRVSVSTYGTNPYGSYGFSVRYVFDPFYE